MVLKKFNFMENYIEKTTRKIAKVKKNLFTPAFAAARAKYFFEVPFRKGPL